MEDTEFADEELPATRAWPRSFLALIAVAVVAALGVAVFRLASNRDEPTAHRPAPAGPTGTYTAPADGPAPSGLPRGCPHLVVCSKLNTQPAPLVNAVLDNLPATMVRRVRTIVYVSPAEHRAVVWYRRLLLRSGDATQIAVEVRQRAEGDQDREESYLIGAERAVRLQRVFSDRTVSLTLNGAGSTLTLEQLRGFAADARLVAT